jgi:uncharacterized protein (DUF427 family)
MSRSLPALADRHWLRWFERIFENGLARSEVTTYCPYKGDASLLQQSSGRRSFAQRSVDL